MHKHNEHILYSKLFIEAKIYTENFTICITFYKDTKAGDEDKWS